MRIETVRPGVFAVMLHAYELSALVAAARWMVEGAVGEAPQEARDQLRQVLDSYDDEVKRLRSD